MAARSRVRGVLVVESDLATRNWFQKALPGAAYDVFVAGMAGKHSIKPVFIRLTW